MLLLPLLDLLTVQFPVEANVFAVWFQLSISDCFGVLQCDPFFGGLCIVNLMVGLHSVSPLLTTSTVRCCVVMLSIICALHVCSRIEYVCSLPFSDYLFKLLLIGDSGVGKSCLLLRFAVSGDTS